MKPVTEKPKDTPRKRKPTLPRGEWELMTLEEWRANKSCVDYAKQLIDTPMFRRLLGMLHNFASEPQQESNSDKALGRIEGMRLMLRALTASSMSLHQAEPISVYEGEETNEQGII